VDAWDVTPGTEALVEVDESATMLTGIVRDPDTTGIIVDFGVSPVPSVPFRAVVSLFTPASLWQAGVEVRGNHDPEGTLRTLVPITVPRRVERRGAPRARCTLAAFVAPDASSPRARRVCGETIDLSVSGVRVRTDREPCGDDPLVTLLLPDGREVSAAARIVRTARDEDGVHTSFQFIDLSEETADAIAHVVAVEM
jgi:hypothetical protein